MRHATLGLAFATTAYVQQPAAMQLVSAIARMQRLSQRWRRAGLKVGFVPTMGALHAGHLSLVKTARLRVGARGKVVVSIYVNPTQFAPHEDFSRYPRDLKRDMALCRTEGVDVVFAPTDREMYPASPGQAFSTYIVEERLSQRMEGASRPRHFRGVTTVVAKLFNIVQPDVAVFGAKDYQQAAIIQRMVRDLSFPVRIVVAPIYREADGLAMSSRNRYLTGDLRTQATVLRRALQNARATVRASRQPVPATRLRASLQKLIQTHRAAQVDYIEFFDPDTLEPVRRVGSGVQLALAVRVGTTRLIDNTRL